MYSITNKNDINNLNNEGFSFFINAEISANKVEYNQVHVQMKINWNTNFDISSFDYVIQEFISHDYKKTWTPTGNDDGTIYVNDKKVSKERKIYNFGILKWGIRQRGIPTSYKYKITIFLDEEKTIGLSSTSNEVTLPALYDYFYSSHCFIKQRYIDNNAWELTFMNVSSVKSEYQFFPIDIKWYLFDDEKSHWIELKEFENKEKIIVNVDLKRTKFKAYERRLSKERPHDSWASIFTDIIELKPRPWFMPNIKNLKNYLYPRVLLLDSINLQNMKKLIKENLDLILNEPKNIPISLIELIKYIFFGTLWKNNILVINEVDCKIEEIEKNDKFIKLEIKVVSMNHYIFKNYSTESYSIIVKI